MVNNSDLVNVEQMSKNGLQQNCSKVEHCMRGVNLAHYGACSNSTGVKILKSIILTNLNVEALLFEKERAVWFCTAPFSTLVHHSLRTELELNIVS